MQGIGFRISTSQDLQRINTWLLEEENSEIEENFLCNWNLTKEKHGDGKLYVAVLEKTDEPIAYQWNGLVNPGILEVRNEWRRKGIGRKFVEFCISEALKSGVPSLHIECTPETSKPFWEKMGFTIYDNDRHAYMLLEREYQLPKHGTNIPVQIRFYPEKRKRDKNTDPHCEFSLSSKRINDEIIQLERRVSIFPNLAIWARDPVVEIIVGDRVIYCDKAKYSEANEIGVIREYNAIYIDVLNVPKPN